MIPPMKRSPAKPRPMKQGMARALDLTRAGKLQEATAMILSLLRRPVGAADPTGAPALADGDVIDGVFTATPPPHAKPAATGTRGPRAPLAETLRKIAAGGMPARAPLTGVQVPVAAEAQFLSLSHSGPQGSRRYRLYLPANRPALPMPLIVMLHGCTQTPEDFALGTGMNALAEEFGCIIAYPEQASGANAQKCWNWFRPEDQGRDRGEPALIAGMTRDIQAAYPADPTRTYIAGLSAGGAAALIVAAAYPEVFAAAGTHSGLPAGGARDVTSAFAAMRSGTEAAPHKTALPVIAFHGLADATVHPSNGTASVAQAVAAMPGLRRSTRQETSAGGRSASVTAHARADGRTMAEHWQIDGAGHAWAGGQAGGSYTDPSGPDASRQMLRFFLQHRAG